MSENVHTPETKPKHPGGRPTKYKPQYCKDLIDFFSIPPSKEVKVTYTPKSGQTFTKYEPRANPMPWFSRFAETIGTNHQRLLEWCKTHEEFQEAYARAKDMQKAMLIENSLAGLYNSQFAIFTAKNITDMRDVKDVNVDAKVQSVADLMAALGTGDDDG